MIEDSRTDIELVRATRGGSLGAYSILVQRHQGRLFHFLHQITGQREEAEDLAQEAFVRAFRKLDRFREDRGQFVSWLFTMARRLAIRAWRKRRRAERLNESASRELEDIAAPPDGGLDRSWVWQQARKALSADSFMVLWLYYQEELAMEEIAGAVGRSKGATKVLLHRSRQRLGKVMDSDRARELLAPDCSAHSLSMV